MPICIECHYPVPQLYHVLHSNSANASHPSSTGYNSPNNGKNGATVTGTTSLSGGTVRGEKAVGGAGWGAGKRTEKGKKGSAVVGGDVRLTQCPRCKRFADKYVEHDFVVLFCDLVLVKPQVSWCPTLAGKSRERKDVGNGMDDEAWELGEPKGGYN